MYTITFIPNYIYESLKANNIPLDILGKHSEYRDDIVEATNIISDMDMLHLFNFNKKYNIFKADTPTPLDTIISSRDLSRFMDTTKGLRSTFKSMLPEGNDYTIEVTPDNMFIILNTNINTSMIKSIFNKVYNTVQYNVLVKSEIIRNYITYTKTI